MCFLYPAPIMGGFAARGDRPRQPSPQRNVL
jgi:hypothetical protein